MSANNMLQAQASHMQARVPAAHTRGVYLIYASKQEAACNTCRQIVCCRHTLFVCRHACLLHMTAAFTLFMAVNKKALATNTNHMLQAHASRVQARVLEAHARGVYFMHSRRQ